MATHPNCNVTLRILALELLGSCDVCGTLVSARRSWALAHELDVARCPRCAGRLTLAPESVFLELACTEVPAAVPPPRDSAEGA